MFGANAWANADDALRYPGKADRELPDREGFGLNPLWRLYPCAQGWIFLAIAREDEWRRLQSLLGEAMAGLLAIDFSSARQGGDPIVAVLGQLFAGAPAASWESRLAPKGVGCVQADAALPEHFFRFDPQAVSEQLLLPAQHPEWGEYLRHGAQVVLHGTPGWYRGASLIGDGSNALLRELGVNDADIAQLRQSGTVA